MPDIINSNIEKQVYAADKKGNLLQQVDKVFVVLSGNSMHVAGFSSSGEVLTIRCHPYDGRPDFLERNFTNEPLLTHTGKVSHIFVTAPKQLLVPKAIYKEDTAAEWLNDLHFVGKDEAVHEYSLRDDKAQYLFAFPLATRDLMIRYFPKARIMPFAAHQFNKHYKTSQVLQCTFTEGEVYLTLYKDRKLQWHQVANYNSVEDVAYQVKLLCQQQNLDEEHLAIIAAAETNILTRRIHELFGYFPNLKIGTGKMDVQEGPWQAAVYLFQQLYSCV
ncbi:DUF3822 family protein [Polluticoccus soli]|uniref:DUF3822 family protein n=1 Tax=Polluticoccus soli TaxID=3034150 RepID=UPI0023E0D030|nr:DUF3822 family protein [Flavipsychrobacter sp. JY13-12]